MISNVNILSIFITASVFFVEWGFAAGMLAFFFCLGCGAYHIHVTYVRFFSDDEYSHKFGRITVLILFAWSFSLKKVSQLE